MDFDDWIVAFIDENKFLHPDKVMDAYNFFSNDKGKLSFLSFKEHVCQGTTTDDDLWEKIIHEVDKDGNGILNFVEFTDLVHRLITWKEGKDLVTGKNK